MLIALLEADLAVATHLSELLHRVGRTVHVYHNGTELMEALVPNTYDLFILDWWAPGRSGLQVLQDLRSQHRENAPVMLLTSGNNARDIGCAMASGANDYCSKPIHDQLFLNRVATLQHNPPPPQTVLLSPEYLGYQFRHASQTVHFRRKVVRLSVKEYQLGLHLFERHDTTVPRTRLLMVLWGETNFALSRSLDVHICALRKKLELTPDSPHVRLVTVYAHGYKICSMRAG